MLIVAVVGAGVIFSLSSLRQKLAPKTEDTATPNLVSETPTPSSTSTTITSTPTPKAGTTPSPSLDLEVLPASNTIVKFGYNKGDGNGWIAVKQFYASDYPSFDEVSRYWSSTVTACFGYRSNENLTAKEIPYAIYLDNILYASGSSKNNSWCWDLGHEVGRHFVKFIVNPDKAIAEKNYDNNSLEISHELRADSVPPYFSFSGPSQQAEGTCVWINGIFDNRSPYSDLTIEDKIDNEPYGPYHYPRFCINGPLGEQHYYWVKITDERGNTTEKNFLFSIGK